MFLKQTRKKGYSFNLKFINCSQKYSYFEKVCRKKCTRPSRKVLWIVLSSLFLKEDTQEAMDVRLRVLKKSSRFDSYSVGNSVLIIPLILPFEIVVCTIFPTAFLEIAVYIDSSKRCTLGNVLLMAGEFFLYYYKRPLNSRTSTTTRIGIRLSG